MPSYLEKAALEKEGRAKLIRSSLTNGATPPAVAYTGDFPLDARAQSHTRILHPASMPGRYLAGTLRSISVGASNPPVHAYELSCMASRLGFLPIVFLWPGYLLTSRRPP